MVVRLLKFNVIRAERPSAASTIVLEPEAGVLAAPSGVSVARKIVSLLGGCGLPASRKPLPGEPTGPEAIRFLPSISQTCIWPLLRFRQRMSDLLSPL